MPVHDSASGGVDPVPGLGMVVLGWILYRQARGVGRTRTYCGDDLAANVCVRGSDGPPPGCGYSNSVALDPVEQGWCG